jgi:hypothetical protein
MTAVVEPSPAAHGDVSGVANEGTPVIETPAASDEEKLDEAVRRALEGLPPEQRSLAEQVLVSIRERLRLSVLHRGEYVAYRDHWKGRGAKRVLVRREVIAHGKDVTAVQAARDRIPPARRRLVVLDFIE